jgi:hypothetical protein
MEYVPGNSLQNHLRASGRLEPERAVLLGTSMAEALQAAHTAGVVHRDIKPANILVRDPDGAFKIADFGIARLSDSELTQAGSTVGSPAYMSPEQIRSRGVDGRSDLFSLASVLYEAFSGKRPFDGKDLPSLAYAVAHDDPRPISSLDRGLPKSLDEFFAKALAKAPEERFQDGKSFALALRQAWRRRVESLPRPADGGPAREPVQGRQPQQGEEPRRERESQQPEGERSQPAGGDGPSAASGPQPASSDRQAGDGDGGSPASDSQPRAYRPRSPARVLRQARSEQRLTEISVIPLARRWGDRPSEAERENGRRSDPRLATAPCRAPWRGIGIRHWRQARLLMIAAVLGAVALWWNFPTPVPMGSVVLDVKNRLQAGTLTVLMDGEVLYGVGLAVEGDRAATSRPQPSEQGNEEFKTTVTIPSGEHVLLVQVKPNGGTRSYQEQVRVDVRPGETHRLRIVTGTKNNPVPTLKFD